MDTIFENDRIIVDYNDYDETYRISFFDKTFHYDDEITIDKEQFNGLREYFNQEKNK
jgi:hypothetical protein